MEKVVNALECCIDGMLCAECGYEGIDRCFDKVLLADAHALLKEQEAVVRCKDCVKHGSVSCPMCKKYVFTTADNWYCAAGERK